LLLSVDPNLTITEIRTILEQSSEDQVGNSNDTAGWDQYYGHGRINAFKALTNNTLNVATFKDTSKDLLVYPNPTTSGSNLKISNLISGENVISIYNLIGQNIYNTRSSTINNSAIISLPELNTGTYILKINNNLKNTATIKKLIIQ
jgi:hypothetical protein